MEQNKKYQTKISILILGIILSCNFVYAFGVGSAYHKDNPLEISAGETEEITFNLQNMPGPKDINFKVSVVKGSEIISLIEPQDIYPLPVGSSLDIKALVTAPSDAEIGDSYPVELDFTTITSTSGEFGFGSSVTRAFDVIIVPTAEEKARLESQKSIISLSIYIIIGLIIAGLIIWIIYKKRKK